MDENLVGYLLHSLDKEDEREMEAHLASSAEARYKLENLRRGLEPLEADREEIAPPPDLVVRTLARVAEYCSQTLPHAPNYPRANGGYRNPWRRVDVLVAAAVLLAAVGVGASALAHLRNQTAPLVECKENLHQFGVALKAYHDQHRGYPDVNREAPYNVAGLFVPMLINAGLLSRDISVRCPGNGQAKPCPYTLDEIHALDQDEFTRSAPYLACCYAYSLGYRDEAGYHAPCYQGAGFPLVSDRAPRDQGPGNSFNHGGTGQNVLFQDGSVRFMTNRSLNFDGDIFRNKAGNIEAGSDRNDTVLGASAVSPLKNED
jgi:hypothetical protein